MPPAAPLTAALNVRMEAALRAKLEREAARIHRTPSALARIILHEHFAARRGTKGGPASGSR